MKLYKSLLLICILFITTSECLANCILSDSLLAKVKIQSCSETKTGVSLKASIVESKTIPNGPWAKDYSKDLLESHLDKGIKRIYGGGVSCSFLPKDKEIITVLNIPCCDADYEWCGWWGILWAADYLMTDPKYLIENIKSSVSEHNNTYKTDAVNRAVLLLPLSS